MPRSWAWLLHPVRDFDLRYACKSGRQDGRVGGGIRVITYRLDHSECDLYVPTHVRGRSVQGAPGEPYRHHAGPAPATVADCVQLWCVLRRCSRFWYSGRCDGGGADRPRFPAARSVWIIADGQYCAGGLWRHRDSPHCITGSDGIEPVAAERTDGTYPAIFLGSGAVLADMGFCRLLGNGRSLAGGAGGRSIFRHTTVFGFEFSRTVARRCGCGGRFHGRAYSFSLEVESQAHLGFRARG